MREKDCTGLSMRLFSQKTLLAMAVSLALLVSGCGEKAPTGGETRERVVRLFNWKDFTDTSLLQEFEEETGIRVELLEYETSQEMIAAIQSKPDSYDVISADTSLIPLLSELRMIENLDEERLPGFSIIKEEIRGSHLLRYEGLKAVPYLWGTTGLVINTDFVPATARSWGDLWNPAFAGKIALLDDTREAMMAVLKSCGFSANTRDLEELRVAEEKALRLKANGVRLGETFENIRGVIRGDLWMAQAYSGDVAYLARGMKNIIYVLPTEGFNAWLDCLLLCNDAVNRDEAYLLLDFFLRPEVSSRAALSFYYGTPVEGAEKIMRESEDYDPSLFPQEWAMIKGEFYMELGETNREYERIFQLLR